MAKYQLKYTKNAVGAIQKLPPQVKKRLGRKLLWFSEQPNALSFAKPLTKPADAQYRYRVGNYRILFDLVGNDIVILYVQHRKDVYRK